MAHFTLAGSQEPIPEQADVIVVGAGMAGLYTTWRILKENPDQEP